MELRDLQELSDEVLAERHSSYRPDTRIYILCQYEWQRRAQLHAFELAERTSKRERAVALGAAAFGVLATLLGVWIAK